MNPRRETEPAGHSSWPTVQLRHDLPDGSHHVDWMIANDPGAERPLMTFRLDEPMHSLAPGERVEAQRIADHRPAYLKYEGPISGDRGVVTRIAFGEILRWHRPVSGPQEAWEMRVRWGVCSRMEHAESSIIQEIRMERTGTHRWTAFCVSIIGGCESQ